MATPYYLICCSAGNDRNDNPAPGATITYVDGMFRYHTSYNPAAHPAGDGVYKSGYDTIAPWGAAKNVLAVGAVTDAVLSGARDVASGGMTSFSSWGPTDDGRIKPDVVANGRDLYSTDDVSDDAYYTSSGTSMSSPNATGSALLLQECYTEKFPGEAMRSSTLKALIIHAADDLGTPGPDYSYGFGLMNTKAAADVIAEGTVAGDAPIIEDALDSGANTSRIYTIPWDGATALRATLCWTDPAGSATAVDDDRTPVLVNDLNLKITTPNGVWYPFTLDYANPAAPAARGVNSVDNVEQVHVNASGTPGVCTVTVDFAGTLTGGAQDFGLIMTLGEPLIAITDVSGPASVGTYEKVDLAVTLANETVTNPYDPDPARGGLDLRAEFTGPSGVWPVPVYGFHDGSAWRIRFAPDEVGAWTFSVAVTDRLGTATWSGGSFECVASSHPGWVRIDDLTGATDWDRLRHANGDIFFGVGHNTGWQYNVEQPPLASMAAQGENLLSFWMTVPWAEPAWASVREPFWDDRSGIENLSGGLGDYNQAACDYIDGVVSRAEAAGVYLLPTIWSHGELRDVGHSWGAGWWYNNAYSSICTATEFFETDDGLGGDTEQWRLQKNYFRYLIARWGYSRAVAGWVAVCEMDGTTGYVDDALTAETWCAAVADYFRASDFYRLNSAGQYPMASSKTDWAADYDDWNPGFDLNASDSYRSQYDDIEVAWRIASETQALRASGLPALHAEFGGDVRSGATEPLHLHNGIWAGLASGACVTPLTWTDGGGWPMLWVPPLPPSGDGLGGEYYANMTLSGPAALTRADAAVDFDWGAGSPDGAIPADAFSVQWTGHVLAEHDEDYTFYVTTGDDEGARLWVDGQALVDDWASPAAGEHSGTVTLAAGARYSVTFEYFEDSGDALARLSWSSASTPKAVVPQARLFSTPVPLAVAPAMRDHLKYLSQFARGLTCLDDATLTDATVIVAGGDSSCEAWGMRTSTPSDRGFAWIHDTDPGAAPTLGGETVTVSGLTPGEYGVFWYNVWTSGTGYAPGPGPVTVAADGILTITVPALARPDIAVRFLPSPEAPTPVVMSSVRTRSVGAGALLEWTTASELENLGFDILRRPAGGGGEFERVTRRPVDGRITAAGEKTYSWLDLVRPGTWEYRVETISTTGVRERHGSGPDVTVTVMPGDAARSMGELARGAAGRLAAGLGAARSRADTETRRGELSRRPPRRNAVPLVAARARILRSVAERTGALPPAGAFRPLAGALKIVTRGDGVFRVPASGVARMPRRARFVTGGTESPPLSSDRDGAWFFAPGYRDRYTDLNATFIVEGAVRGPHGASGARPPPRKRTRGPALTTARAVSRAETDGMYAIGLPSLRDPWVYPRLVSDSSGEVTVELDVPGLMPGPTTLRVAVCGYTEDARVSPDHELIVSLNGSAVGGFVWDGREPRAFEVALPNGAVLEGANAVGLLAPRNPAIPRGHGFVLDYVEIEHERRLSLASGPFALELAQGAGGAAEVEVDLGPGGRTPWVVEIDASGRSCRVATRVRPLGTGGVACFTAREGLAYYVAPADGIRSAESITTARVASVAPGTEYIAVGPEEFRDATAPLIEMHRAGGMRAEYVSLTEASDTWGWGRYGAAAIVNLVGATDPRYLLLVGDNAYDYLGRAAGDAGPMVPAFLARSSMLAETNADALYGDLDADGAPDIPVGRLPVRTAGELSNLVRKIVSHGIAGSRAAGVLLAGRSGGDEDFAGASRRVAARFATIDWTELYAGVHGDEAAVRAALARTVDAGTDLVVYQGHGAVSALGKGLPLLDPAAAARWKSTPVVYLATCWGAFLQHKTEDAKSVAEALLRAPAGATAVVGSTTPCAQWAQEMLLMDFLEGAIDRGEPLGDALVAAQRRAAGRATSAEPGAAESLMDVARFYALLGDPAMGLAGPARRE